MGLPAPSSDALASSFSEVLLAGVAHVSVAGLKTSFFLMMKRNLLEEGSEDDQGQLTAEREAFYLHTTAQALLYRPSSNVSPTSKS